MLLIRAPELTENPKCLSKTGFVELEGGRNSVTKRLPGTRGALTLIPGVGTGF